ncbi:MAG: tetratricopeptide repeat protein [Phycisphaerae bacterium]
MIHKATSFCRIAILGVIAAPLAAQTAVPRRAGNPPAATAGPDTRAAAPAAPVEPYLLRRGHYVYPAPYSPDYSSSHLRPYNDYSLLRDRFDNRRGGYGFRRRGFSRYEQGFGGGHSYRYGGGYPYGGDSYGYDAEEAYNQGRYDADHEYLWYIAAERAGRLLNQYAAQFDDGVLSFRAGNYERALVDLLGAAEKNHANAASRLHAGHTLFALGRYDEAVRLIARAFELAPSLPYKRYDIRDEYGDKADFRGHLQALKSFVIQDPKNASALAMLGYVTFYTEGPGASFVYLKHAHHFAPADMFIPKLLNIARLTAGAEPNGRGHTSPTPRRHGANPSSIDSPKRTPAPSSERISVRRVSIDHD